MSYVYTLEEAYVPKPSRAQMGNKKPKINNAAVVHILTTKRVTLTNFYEKT